MTTSKGLRVFESIHDKNADEFAVEFHKLIRVDEAYEAGNRLWEILLDKAQRERIFKEFLEMTSYKIDIDWFNFYFQREHADRKKQKQDFTPPSISRLMSRIIREMGEIECGVCYEPCAGTGSMLIQDWNEVRLQTSPFIYSPMEHFYVLEEQSGRVIPFLLFNLAIRGINAVVMHMDTISRNCKGVFFIQNTTNDPMSFSNVHIMPQSEMLADEFGLNFVNEELYETHVEENWISNPDLFQQALHSHDNVLAARERLEQEENPIIRDLISLFGL